MVNVHGMKYLAKRIACIAMVTNALIAPAQNLVIKLAFMSDTQAPMWIEDVFLKNHNNVEATQVLFKDALLQAPKDIFILGDVVNLGHKNSRWKAVDKFLLESKRQKIPVFAVLGNHELMGRSQQGELNFQSRFPDHVSSGYLIRVDSVAIILLNSNFSSMNPLQIEKQDEWYKTTLKSLDEDHTVGSVMVSCHHSPYSNSKLVGSNETVQEKFVAPYLKSAKTKIFLSGHAHLFQHFKKEGKHFLVIGGGGGLKHPRKSELMEDESGGYEPLFHYVIMELQGNGLKIISRKIKTDFSSFEDGYSFFVK
jgi:Icc-related predicted phosphoesterase